MKLLNAIQGYLVLPVCLVLISMGISHADTRVGGNIATDTTWTLANSPYIVAQPVTILHGATLTIEPGVTVKFACCQEHGQLFIEGQLVAQGTETQMITFISNSTDPDPVTKRWGYLEFLPGAVRTTLDENGDYVRGSIIKYCRLDGGGVHAGTELYIANNTITNAVGWGGILCDFIGDPYEPRAYSTITGNLLYNNVDGGIMGGNLITGNTVFNTKLGDTLWTVSGISGNIVSGNTVYDNEGYGIMGTTVSGNTVYHNGFGGTGQLSGWTWAGISGETVTGNLVYNNHGHGICGGIISGNIVYGNDFYGIVGYAGTRILENTVYGNYYGIYAREGNTVTGNTVVNNREYGVVVQQGDLTVTDNNLQDNGLYSVINFGPGEVSATNNWWGTTDPPAIKALIYDHEDDPAVGTVIFQPFAQSRFIDSTDGGYWSFDEPKGIIAYNTPDNRNKGIIYGAARSPGFCGGALQFNGMNDYVEIPGFVDQAMPNGITIEAWINLDELPESYKTIASKEENGEFHVYQDGTLSAWLKNSSDELYHVFGQTPLSPGIWYHVAMTCEANGFLRVYVNGTEDGSTLFPGNLMTNFSPFQIGQDQGFPGRFFKGLIDEVHIYRSALSAEEIQADSKCRTGKLTGAIIDAKTGMKIAGATVSVTPGNFSVITTGVKTVFGMLGHDYELDNVPVGIYTITASKRGYLENSQTEVVIAADETARVDIILTPG